MQNKALPYPYQHSVQTGIAAMSVAQESRSSSGFSDTAKLPSNVIDLCCNAHQSVYAMSCSISSQANARSITNRKSKFLSVYKAAHYCVPVLGEPRCSLLST
jgi:hypothetical protein